jgi:uncharacterized protein DUF262
MAKETRSKIDTEIAEARNEIRTDKLDMSFGELANLYESEELVIRPEYQRLFRWTATQKARFVESILLGFPTPAIFVAEDDKGIWELVDGLQRVSTVLEFMGSSRMPQENSAFPPGLWEQVADRDFLHWKGCGSETFLCRRGSQSSAQAVGWK